ncbi:SLC13 family permease [Arenimonas caeni]|jgi:di/tricarboxylate transporter|uniref:SLC13 family permease n=1 Tax=Arenimonas caeni TaxID=2058085 RepID=A0A2P6M8I4_9GAMM|nr:SLC13 family permease [Arenimonas caeni]MDY0021443.1 SLC13 family permease [Arenimonas caeni]PRH82281.1 SLC13 family permease [Arenimonas caeni]
MEMDAILTLLVLVGAVALFVTEKLPVDVVAMLVLASLLVLGLVNPAEALSGFSSEATITVAAMFVLSAGLAHTGALLSIGRLFGRVRRPWLFLLLILVVVGPISAFVNNTAAVAVFLPMVLAATAANRSSPSQVLIPMSYAAQMGGVCTLIGTSTNLLVNSMAKDLGHPGFGLFDFAPLGLVTMAVGFVYLMLFRRWLLPHHPPTPLTETYELGKYITELRVMPDSPLIGHSVSASQLAERHKVYVLELLRGTEKHWAPRAERLREGDVLLVRGDWTKLKALKDEAKLELEPEFQLQDSQFTGEDGDAAQVLLEVMVAPGARLAGRSLRELDFQWNYNATVLALHRRGEVLREQIRDVSLNVGDVMLLLCPRTEVDAFRANQNLVVLNERDDAEPPRSKALLAVGIMAAAVGVAALGWLPIVASSILGGIALVATRCIGNDQAYQAVDWRVIVLLAGVLPLGIAMQKSGLAQGIADFSVHWVGGLGPLAVLAAVYLITSLLTELMSNNAAAVLITPIAFSTAVSLGVSPTPFLVAVLFAASTSFATPVGYQTNTMVYNAGNYRFMDFIRIGMPLNLLFWGLAVYLIPKFFPF